ncbi:unnamed protein product [Macrosiphum euphorbiae]|uniref:Uncharacterized protein n=1 Tax=Macrosiphum euphorbiae TaxID=13131 RepID=A0AAV0XZA3_9HEMI|nr:unnamed protein product [Macrosiphum euphorbiae]
MLVTLDPTLCYADSVSQFFLNYFLGYDNLLLSSVQSLAENERNKGFLRNVISEEYKRVDRISKSRSSYILSFFIMVVFVSIR